MKQRKFSGLSSSGGHRAKAVWRESHHPTPAPTYQIPRESRRLSRCARDNERRANSPAQRDPSSSPFSLAPPQCNLDDGVGSRSFAKNAVDNHHLSRPPEGQLSYQSRPPAHAPGGARDSHLHPPVAVGKEKDKWFETTRSQARCGCSPRGMVIAAEMSRAFHVSRTARERTWMRARVIQTDSRTSHIKTRRRARVAKVLRLPQL